MGFQQKVKHVKTEPHGITQIGSNIQLILSNPDIEREGIRRWFAPWLYLDWNEGRSQPKILSSLVGVSGCGLWLLENALPKWYASSQDGLWLTGEVGCGKSILCSFVVKHLDKTLQPEDSQQIVIPLIFSFSDKYTHTFEFLTNTVLAYLCSAEPIPEPIVQARGVHVSPSTIHRIEDLIMRVITTMGPSKSSNTKASVILVVDALDEVPCESQTANMEILNRLIGLNSRDCDSRIRIILFTRPDIGIQSHCRSSLGWQKMPIPRSEVNRDIGIAVGTRLDKGTRLGREDTAILTAQVVKKAAGMFRLASLYIDDLVKSTRRRSIELTEFKQRLEELPAELYVFYDRILHKVQGDLMPRTLKALQWIMFSARSLLVEDLIEACAIISPSRVPFESEQERIYECLDLIDCLSGLVRIQPPLSEDEVMSLKLRTHFVTMAHFSVNEYLQKLDTARFGIDSNCFDKAYASLYLSQACFIYILEATKGAHSTTSETMLDYANQCWPVHLASYFLETDATRYQDEATNAALASKIRNLIEFPDLDMYDDCSSLQQHVRNIAQSCLKDSRRCDRLFGNLLRNTHYRKNIGPSEKCSEPSCGDGQHQASLYYPLEPGHFRLVILHPAEKHKDSLRCSLVVDNLRNRANYSYLSYVWGRSDHSSLIHVNGLPLLIVSNLSKALSGLRDVSKPVIFWVDAICINQANMMERVYQFAQMAEFVEYASSTQVWLPDECTGDVTEPTFLRDLYSQTYWHRRWVQQELILARDIRIQWAKGKMSWADLRNVVQEKTPEFDSTPTDEETISAIRYFSDLQWLRESPNTGYHCRQSQELQKPFRLSGPPFIAEALLYMLRNTTCTDPRDTLYSILALLSVEEVPWFESGYTMPFPHVMRSLAELLIERSGSYNVLSMVDRTRVFDGSGTPSWVPTWTHIEDHPLASPGAAAKQAKLYGTCATIPTFVDNGETLCVKGWPIGNISYAEKIVDTIHNRQSVKVEWGLLVRVALENRCRENPLCAFQRMTTQSRDWFTELPDASRLLSELESRGSRAKRCIARTDSNLLANVPAYTAIGDVIAIFHGGEVPYVLRPDDGYFTLIGECYVDGYMDGQATRERTNDNPDVTFRIR